VDFPVKGIQLTTLSKIGLDHRQNEMVVVFVETSNPSLRRRKTMERKNKVLTCALSGVAFPSKGSSSQDSEELGSAIAKTKWLLLTCSVAKNVLIDSRF